MADFSNEPTDVEMSEVVRLGEKKSPDVAAQDINRAHRYDMHPDEYNSMKDVLEPEAVLQERIPAQVHDKVKNFAKKSSQHAPVVEQEVGLLDRMARQADFIWYNLTEKQDIENEIQRLNNIDRTSETGLDDNQRETLNTLYELQQEEIESFDIPPEDQTAGQVAGVVNDMARAIFDNKAIVAGSVVTGAGIGAATPFGPVGATAGATAGLGVGVTAALTKDAYFRTADATYGELQRMKNDDGTPLNIDRDTKQNISFAVGGVSAVLEGVTGAVITGGIGSIGKRVASKSFIKKVVTSPRMLKQYQLLGAAMKSAISGGGEEASAEIVAILGENYAKLKQDENNENALMDSIELTVNQVMNDEETQKRISQTAKVGAIAGGTITSVAGQVKIEGSERARRQRDAQFADAVQNTNFKAQQRIQKARQIIETQNNILNVAATAAQTNLKELSPQEMFNLRKDLFADKDGMFSFTEEDLLTLGETDPELVEQIKSLDATESSSQNTNSGVILYPHDFLALVEDAPTVSEYARLNPQAPNASEAKQFLTNLEAANQQRTELLQSLEADQEMTPEQTQTLESLNAIIEESSPEGMDAYVEDFKLNEVAESAFSEKQLEAYNKAQRETRESVATALFEQFDKREKQIEDRVVRANKKIEQERIERQYAEEIRLQEWFKGDTKVKVEGHARKGYSPIAIDPETLPDNLRDQYVSDPKLIKNKAFVKGGISLEEAAAIAGYEDGQQMLKVLANAPTKKELLEIRKERLKQIREQVRETRIKSYEERLDKVFDDVNKLHRDEMQVMKTDQWAQTKSGIKKVNLPMPKIEEINFQARQIIKNTKVDNLSPKQFNQGERVLQRRFNDQILKNQAELAFQTKEKAILNSELSRESLKARNRVNEAKAFVKRLKSPKVQRQLKKSGLAKEVDAILELFNLTTVNNNKLSRRQDNFAEYVKKMEAAGQEIAEVPPTLADVRQRGAILTVDQYLKITDKLRSLEHQSRLKNKLESLRAKREEVGKLATVEAVVAEANEDLRNHPKFDEARNRQTQNESSKKLQQKMGEYTRTARAALSNMKNIVVELQQENLQGQHYDNLVQPLVDSETFKRDRIFQVKDQIKSIIDQYGEENFRKAFHEEIIIPEFEGYAHLGNGSMVKADLWNLFAYLGDPDARTRMENFKHHDFKNNGKQLNADKITKILENHLTHEDAKLAQNFTNIFKSFEQEAFDLHQRTTGVEPVMVKGVPITFKGRVYEGGYVPNKYLNADTAQKIDRFQEILGNKAAALIGPSEERSRMYAALKSAEMTEQGRLITRTNSVLPLDTNFMNIIGAYEEHIHDIAYRERGTDVLKLLKNPTYEQGIVGVVGKEKYDTIVNATIEAIGKTSNDDILSPFSSDHKNATKLYKYFEQNFSVAQLGLNLNSILMQGLSIGPAKLRMGKNSSKYLAKSFASILKNDFKSKSFWEAAVETNPDLQYGVDSVDDTLTKSMFDIFPRKAIQSDARSLLNRGKDALVEMSMLGLQKLDVVMKAGVSLAAYNQYMDGAVEGTDMTKFNQMTFEEKHAEAKKYVKRVADLALTTSATIDKSSVEKIGIMRLFTRFYTDSRSQLNTFASQGRKIDLAVREKNFKKAAYEAGSVLAVSALTRIYIDSLYDEENPISNLSEVNDINSLGNYLTDSVSYIVGSPINTVTGVTPVARDVQFAMGGWFERKQASTWVGRSLSDLSTAMVGLSDLLQGDGMSDTQKKAMLFSIGYGVGLPINGPTRIMEDIQDSETMGDIGSWILGGIQMFAKQSNEYIKRHQDDPEKQDIIKGLKEIQKQYVPPTQENVEELIPENAIEKMRMNEWNHYNRETGGAGVFEFTEEAWDKIIELAPDLNLTEEGRTSKDTSEQEAAMKWEIDHNAKVLVEVDLEPNTVNLYGAHRFGVDDYAIILLSDDNEKLSDIVANPDLFKGFDTVKDVKAYVNKQIDN